MPAPFEEGLSSGITGAFGHLRSSLPGLLAVSLGDANGLPVAFSGPAAEKEAATAMASLLVSAAQRAAQLLGLPHVRDLIIDADGSSLLVQPVGARFILMAILGHGVDMGHAKLLLQSCSDDLLIALERAA